MILSSGNSVELLAPAEMQDVVNAKCERQERQNLYLWYGLLAELQGAAGAVDDALASIAAGLELAEQGLHRPRGGVFISGARLC